MSKNGVFGKITALAAVLIGSATCSYYYYITGWYVLLIFFSLFLLLFAGCVFYFFRGFLCKNRVIETGKTICSRCKGYYFGLFISIVISILLMHFGIPCLDFWRSCIVILLALILGIPTMIQGYFRRTGRQDSLDNKHTTFCGFLVGIAYILSFIGIYSIFGCPIIFN